MTRIAVWLVALGVPLILWHECGEDVGVFCYRIGLGAFTSLRSRVLVPVPVRNSDYPSAARNNPSARLHPSLLPRAFDPDGLRELIRAGGAPLICTIVFIETGFFVGFFLPEIPSWSPQAFFPLAALSH